jgi:hypothetical protein
MARRGWRAALGATIPALGGLVVSTGCSDVFGFEHSASLVDCVRDSDCLSTLRCLSNRCVPECIRDKDCEPPAFPVTGYACIDKVCVAKADAAVNGVSQDAAPEGVADAAADGTADRTDNSTDAGQDSEVEGPDDASADVAACLGCGDGGEGCLVAWYTPRGEVPPGATTNYYGMPSNTLIGQRIFIAHAGCLTRLGIFVSRLQNYALPAPTNYELGLYGETEGGGYPSQLIWRSPKSTIASGVEQNEVEVSPPVSLAASTYYWIVGVSSDLMAFETYGTDGDWVFVTLPAFDAPWGQTFPSPSQNPPTFLHLPQAVEYAIVTSK